MTITWRNINAPSFGAANLLATSGANRISEGIQQLSNIANRQGERVQQSLDETKAKNTDEILNRINSLSSMEDYNTALSEGVFDNETLSNLYGNQIDLKAIHNALSQRDNTIMQEETDVANYANALRARKDAPIAADFSAQLLKATTPEQISELTSSIDSLGLSSQGKAAALQTAADKKQSLLDARYEQTKRNQQNILFNQGQVDRRYEEEARFVSRFDEQGKLDNQTDIQHYSSAIDSLPKKYNLPENFDDVIQSGTASDAISEYVRGLDAEKVAVDDVQSDLLGVFKDTSFTAPTGQEFVYQNLPYWVVKQSLQDVTKIDNSWDFTDFGKADISSTQLDAFKKAINANLSTYSSLVTKKETMQKEAEVLNSQLLKAQREELRRIADGRKAFKESRKPKGNF